jgi:hypothetical protein
MLEWVQYKRVSCTRSASTTQALQRCSYMKGIVETRTRRRNNLFRSRPAVNRL